MKQVINLVGSQREIKIAVTAIRKVAFMLSKEIKYGKELRISAYTDADYMNIVVHTPTEDIVFSKTATPELTIFNQSIEVKKEFLEALDNELTSLGFNSFSDEWYNVTTYSQQVIKLKDDEIPRDPAIYQNFLKTINNTYELMKSGTRQIMGKIDFAKKAAKKGDTIQVIITNSFPMSVCIACCGVEIAVFPAPKNLPTPQIFKENAESQFHFRCLLTKALKHYGYSEVYDPCTNSTSYSKKV